MKIIWRQLECPCLTRTGTLDHSAPRKGWMEKSGIAQARAGVARVLIGEIYKFIFDFFISHIPARNKGGKRGK